MDTCQRNINDSPSFDLVLPSSKHSSKKCRTDSHFVLEIQSIAVTISLYYTTNAFERNNDSNLYFNQLLFMFSFEVFTWKKKRRALLSLPLPVHYLLSLLLLISVNFFFYFDFFHFNQNGMRLKMGGCTLLGVQLLFE